jgi:hypothetical protein
MNAIVRYALLAVGIMLVLGSVWIDPAAKDVAFSMIAAETLQVIGVSLILAIVVFSLEQHIHAKLREGPKVTLITADQRCDQLKLAVGQYTGKDLFTTRYSSRPIGDADKSKAYLAALKARIFGGGGDTYRIVTLDNEKKLEHTNEMLREYWERDNFSIKVLDPKSGVRLIDLVSVDGHFVCIGIETRTPAENYWIRIDDPDIATHFRKYFFETHWNRPEATEIKPLRRFNSESDRDNAIKTVTDIYKKIHGS